MKIFAVTLVPIVLFTLLCNFNAKISEDVDNVRIDVKEGNFSESWNAPGNLKKNYPYYLSGYDKEGRPIWIIEFGKWDVKKIADGGFPKTEKLDAYVDTLISLIRKSTNKKDTTSVEKKALGWVCIFDMENYGFQQLMSFSTVTYVKTLAEKMEVGARNMDFGFLINLNDFAAQLVNQMKPVLGSTLDRAEIHGTDKAEWLPAILKRLPKYSLPEKYGGYANFTPVEM